MLRFSSLRHMLSGNPSWRFPQHIKAPYYSTNVHLQFHTQASSVLVPPRLTSTNKASSVLVPPRLISTDRLFSIRPLRWPAARFCHQGTSRKTHDKADFSLKALTQAPKPALYVGFSVLIPFLSAPLMMASMQTFHPELAFAQLVYGASIVSFLGGVRWGFAIPAGSPAQPDWMNLGNSVVPSLLAWLALLCRDNVQEGALVVIMGLGLSLYYDLTLLPGYPSWFKAMRTILTLVATFSLVATLTIKQFCSEKKIEIQNRSD